VPADARFEPFVLDATRLDASGRFCTRSLPATLARSPGQRVDLRIGADMVVITSCADSRQAVRSRGELTLPVSARALAGLDRQTRIVLIAAPAQNLLIVHPPTLIARLLTDHYRSQPHHNHDRPRDRDDG
jgi:hypothetical protein